MERRGIQDVLTRVHDALLTPIWLSSRTGTQTSQDKLRHPESTPFLGAKTPQDAQGFTVRPTLGDLQQTA